MNDIKERGEASFNCELKDGVITVIHGTDKVTLAEWTAENGDWNKLWELIREMEGMAK